MKELTIEQKAKLYDEAVEKLQKALTPTENGCKISGLTRCCIENIFPELKESADDKIRKGIKSVLKHYKESGEVVCPYPFVSIDDALAWLEMQGEQKVSYTTIVETGNGGINALVTRELPIDGCDGKQEPTDKVEPKFKNGQWIVWQDKYYKVNYNGCGYELFDQNGLSTSWGYKAVEDNAHLWDVTKDAKPGDVLYSQKHNLIWIYKDNKHYYASINLNYADGISFDGDIVIPSDVCPATKEQRDLLFQKINWL